MMNNITRAYSGDYMCRLEDHYHDSKKKFLHLHHHHDQHLSHHQHHHDKHHLHQNDHVDWCYLQCWQWSRKLPCAGINKHWRPLWVFPSVQHDDDDHNERDSSCTLGKKKCDTLTKTKSLQILLKFTSRDRGSTRLRRTPSPLSAGSTPTPWPG